MDMIAPGVWKVSLGSPEPFVPSALREEQPRLEAMAKLPACDCPVPAAAIAFRSSPRGATIEIPIADAGGAEHFYGLGLQLGSLDQGGRKRTLRVNSDPVGDAGDSHAPVPLVFSTAGYGIYVDTARYATFYLGSHKKLAAFPAPQAAAPVAASQIATSTEQLYAARAHAGRSIVIEIPVAQGADIYLIAGPTLRHAVQRYNLFSGGGCLPPLWGLGVWYRIFGQANQTQALALAQSLRDARLPCDVLGFEPGWQTRAYSCSYVWNDQLFPKPQEMLAQLRQLGYHINLWEHVFVHPSSPLYSPLHPLSGDYEVWGGLVPDLSLTPARAAFADYHRRQLVDKGVTGFKLDECDGSDFIRNSSWSFPENSQFPSGMDGEQMHSLLGLLYQRTINGVFESAGIRSYQSVRSSGAFASSLPFVLYSDLYDHRDFIRGVATSSFSGLLWTPEVRHATNTEDLIRRLQSVVLSPQALVNAWYIKNPPWLQYDRDKNNAGELLPQAAQIEAAVRELFRLRMALLPYLYTAFARYHFDGVPPFRALAMDYPHDPKVHRLDDQYLIGEDLLFAPLIAGQSQRDVYFPAGDWYQYQTGTCYPGGMTHSISADLETVLLFVRGGATIPWAQPVEFVDQNTIFSILPRGYGVDPRPAMLFEDDGISFAFRRGDCNWVTITADGCLTREGDCACHRYTI